MLIPFLVDTIFGRWLILPDRDMHVYMYTCIHVYMYTCIMYTCNLMYSAISWLIVLIIVIVLVLPDRDIRACSHMKLKEISCVQQSSLLIVLIIVIVKALVLPDRDKRVCIHMKLQEISCAQQSSLAEHCQHLKRGESDFNETGRVCQTENQFNEKCWRHKLQFQC